MKKLILAIVMLFAVVGVVKACPQYQYVTNWAEATHIERVDVGNADSEANYILENWGTVSPTNYHAYGDGSVEDLRTVWGPLPDDTNYASVTLSNQPSRVKAVTIKHLDGVADDSFDVYVNDIFAGHYTGVHAGWVETTYPLDNLTGDITVKIVSMAGKWEYWSGWGQVAIDWVEFTMNGYGE